MKIALVVGCMLTVWKAVMAKEATEGQRFPCQSWQGVTGTALYAMAKSPNWIGDSSTGQWCRIYDARNCTSCACDYYVKYSSDNGATWGGVSFSGTGTGTGCPGAPAYTSSNQAQATMWLETKYIAAGLCGCTNECEQVNCDGGKCSKTAIEGLVPVGECKKGSGCKCYKKQSPDDCEESCKKKGGVCLDKWQTSQGGEYIGRCSVGKWPRICYCGYCFKRCVDQDGKCQRAGGRCQVRQPGRNWIATNLFCDREGQCKCWCEKDNKECQVQANKPLLEIKRFG